MQSFLKSTATLLTCAAMSGSAYAGSIFLTGHDVLLHDGQSGFDNVVVNWLRGAGTTSEIAASNYSISVIGSGIGNWGWTDVPGFNDRGAKPGFESTTFYDTDTMTDASWAAALAGDLLVILSHTSCGGCDLSTAGSAAINARSGEITAAFNAGMDIWGLSGASLATYYDFLPPGAVASGLPIGGSSGFTSTPEGTALGFTDSMINGFPTHNRFVGFDPDFTVFEVRGTEIISIGIRDATISDGGIGGGGGGTAPEPGSLALIGLGALGLALTRRRLQK